MRPLYKHWYYFHIKAFTDFYFLKVCCIYGWLSRLLFVASWMRLSIWHKRNSDRHRECNCAVVDRPWATKAEAQSWSQTDKPPRPTNADEAGSCDPLVTSTDRNSILVSTLVLRWLKCINSASAVSKPNICALNSDCDLNYKLNTDQNFDFGHALGNEVFNTEMSDDWISRPFISGAPFTWFRFIS